jgi:hypothetical protein
MEAQLEPAVIPTTCWQASTTRVSWGRRPQHKKEARVLRRFTQEEGKKILVIDLPPRMTRV